MFAVLWTFIWNHPLAALPIGSMLVVLAFTIGMNKKTSRGVCIFACAPMIVMGIILTLRGYSQIKIS